MMDTISERLPPHSIEAEEAVLGSLLIDPDAVFEVQTFLRPEDFYRAANRWVYEAICALYDRKTPLDVVTLIEELRRRERLEEIGGESTVISLLNAVPTSINVEAYGNMVRDSAVRRRLIAAAGQIAKLAWDESLPRDQVLGQAERAVFAVSGELTGDSVTDARAAFDALYDVTAGRRDAGGLEVGIPSGLVDLDRILRGFKNADLYIVAGRPAMGKSSFATSLVAHMAGKLKLRVALFTLEMSVEQQSRRLASMDAGIAYQDLEEGRMDDDTWTRFATAAGRWAEAKLWIDDTAAITPSQMAAKARRIHAEHGLDILFVDYLQLMGVDEKAWSDNYRVSLISAGLKKIAKDLNIPVVALCQLNRGVEARGDKRPDLSDLRDSGSLEQDATAVVFLYRDDYYNPGKSDKPNVTEVIVRKHRNGPTGSADVYFNARLMKFANLQRQEVNL
jgi:replicative DNA helicase